MSDTMRTEYDRLIEEYMAGEMSPAALRAFDRKVASDPALRRLLDAELEITRTVRRDTPPVPAVTPVMSARLMARIAETAPGAAGYTAGASVAAGSAGRSAWRWTILLVALLGVGALGLLLFPNLGTPERVIQQKQSVPAAAPAIVKTPQASVQADSSTPRIVAPTEEKATVSPRPVARERQAKATAVQPSKPGAQPRDEERALREYMEKQEKTAVKEVEESDKVRTTIGSE